MAERGGEGGVNDEKKSTKIKNGKNGNLSKTWKNKNFEKNRDLIEKRKIGSMNLDSLNSLFEVFQLFPPSPLRRKNIL